VSQPGNVPGIALIDGCILPGKADQQVPVGRNAKFDAVLEKLQILECCGAFRISFRVEVASDSMPGWTMVTPAAVIRFMSRRLSGTFTS
jgi:hypothetical protein